MKTLSIGLCLGVLALVQIGCQSEESSAYTGREIQYPLVEGSYFDQVTSGYLVARERTDQSVELTLTVHGTTDEAIHPVHLHFGSLGEDQPVAALLNPLEDIGNHESLSVTRLDHLYNDSPVTFDAFTAMDGSVKIHFEETGQWEDVILGATNIGRNYSVTDAATFKDITLCNGNTGQ